MPQVRCPQCGAINDTNAPDYPFCIGCQDNLARCGHCHWFDREASLCLSPAAAGMFDVAPDATPPCDQHTPGEMVLVRTRGYLPFAAAGVALALLVLVYAAVLLLRVPAAAVQLSLIVDADPHPVLNVPCVARVDITNPGNRVANGIRLQINKKSLASFRLLRAAPVENARETRGEWVALSYPALHPGETRGINLHLLPIATGAHNLVIAVVSSGNNFHGMADVPVTVSERRPVEATR